MLVWLSTYIPYQLNIVSDYAITQYRTNASDIAHLVRIVCSGLYAILITYTYAHNTIRYVCLLFPDGKNILALGGCVFCIPTRPRPSTVMNECATYAGVVICLALSRDLRMCHCGQGTSRIFGPSAISPAVLSQWENGALLFASILT